MSLSQLAILKAVAKDKPLRLYDGEGLHLLVQPGGGKLWRFRYRFAGRENMLALGSFPTITLSAARRKREDARRLLADGIDPAAERKLNKLAAITAAQNTFGALAKEYLGILEANGAAETTLAKNRWMLERLAAPLSSRPITQIVPAEVLNVLKRIEKSGRRETARKLRGTIGSVFRHAIVTLRATVDPTAPLQRALLRPIVTHRPAITDEKALGALMLSIDEYDGWSTIRAALQIIALTMTRPGDVRGMRRSEIDFEKALWRIPAERMKMRRPHDVPLSTQTIAILRDIWTLSDDGDLVLPSIRSAGTPNSYCFMTLSGENAKVSIAKEERVVGGETKWQGRLLYVEVGGFRYHPIFAKVRELLGESIPDNPPSYRYRVLFRESAFGDRATVEAVDQEIENNVFATQRVPDALSRN
jgi:integrase